MNELFYSNVEENENNKEILLQIKEYSLSNNEQIYIINKPLGENKYNYEYQNNALIILRPKHKIVLLNLIKEREEDFIEYCEDFIEDLSSISDKFEYKNEIGRPRVWKKELIVEGNLKNNSINKILKEHEIPDKKLQRKCELLISLLIGSINNVKQIGVEEPETLLDKVKNKILLFDGEQTRFIYKNIEGKRVNIQGLSGSGKTELLLHKLKEIYITTDAKIFLTCHNRILAKTIKTRIPEFFNFMKVEKQIEWDQRLWVSNAWGSESKKNSGLYSFICDFYGLNFSRYNKYSMSFEDACSIALKELKNKKEILGDEFKYALDYILIDESQDFSKDFFSLCELVVSEKIYIAGDIFQNIFEDKIHERMVDADFILNRCYRTDPRTFIFAQALGMGLFEKTKFNWLTDNEWGNTGYIIKRDEDDVFLSRKSIRRFEDLELENEPSVEIKKIEKTNEVIDVIKEIRKTNPTVQPDDIAIIYLDSNNYIYDSADRLGYKIFQEFGWETNKGYENKEKIENTVFISNKNNVKGLEFTFVICITKKLQNSLNYRNTIYTMLTRSFIKSYLLIKECDIIENLNKSLEVINNENYIKTKQPTPEELKNIKKTIINQKKKQVSYDDFLNEILIKESVGKKYWKQLKGMIKTAKIDNFDEEKTIKFIHINKEFL